MSSVAQVIDSAYKLDACSVTKHGGVTGWAQGHATENCDKDLVALMINGMETTLRHDPHYETCWRRSLPRWLREALLPWTIWSTVAH